MKFSKFSISKSKKLKLSFISVVLISSILSFSACTNTHSINNRNSPTENSTNNISSTTQTTSEYNSDKNSISNLNKTELPDYDNYSLEELVEEFSEKNGLLRDALMKKIFDIVLETTENHNYKLLIKDTNYETDEFRKYSLYFKDNNCKAIIPDLLNENNNFISLYLRDENNLYFYSTNKINPEITLTKDYTSELTKKINFPGRGANLLDSYISISSANKIEWKELNGKKVLYFCSDGFYKIHENYVDIETGFSLLSKDGYLDSDENFVVTKSSELINYELDPEFPKNEFELPKLRTIIDNSTHV